MHDTVPSCCGRKQLGKWCEWVGWGYAFWVWRSGKKQSSDRLMYAPRRWALKKRSLLVLGKVFRAALSLVGLFGLLRSWSPSARTGAQRMGWIGRLQPGS